VNKEIPGNSSYKEVVDFGEHIGIYKDLQGLVLATTRGTIHY
jgi:hypothetical protein